MNQADALKKIPNMLKEKQTPSVYTVSRFRTRTREALNKAEIGEEVLIVRHGAIFALISVELALKNQPLAGRIETLNKESSNGKGKRS